MITHSRLVVLALSTVATLGLLGIVQVPATFASCVGPAIEVAQASTSGPTSPDRAELRRGARVTVTGAYFHQGCEDTSAAGPGCHAPAPSDPESPSTDLELIVVQGSQTWVLGTADAASRAQQYAVSWTVTVPPEIKSGTAELRAGTAVLAVEIT